MMISKKTAENALFRRQFILGERSLHAFPSWKVVEFSNLYLSIHPDLEHNQVEIEGRLAICLGYIIDPYNPSHTTLEILKSMLENSSYFDDFLTQSYHLSGRWIVIYNDSNHLKLFNDPCGLRQVYYIEEVNSLSCGSQPSILKELTNAEYDNSVRLKKLIESQLFKNSEDFWIGENTIFKNIKHLMPNHYLDIENKSVKRFWIDKEINKENSLSEIVDEASVILKGSIEGLLRRSKAMLALTAGWDSRVLLAASKEYKSQINYFVSTMNILKENDKDIAIPTALSKRLGLNFSVLDNLKPLGSEFLSIYRKNIHNGRILAKTLTIQHHFKYSEGININGNASEICRLFYGANHPPTVDAEYMVKYFGYDSDSYLADQVRHWFISVDPAHLHSNFTYFDLFYWEQRMGNWGSLYQAEQDIAIEEFSPFNNRKLVMMMTKVDCRFRRKPEIRLYRQLIDNMWSSTLKLPINPIGTKERAINILKKIMPISLKNRLALLMR